jgi:hypothetical protein
VNADRALPGTAARASELVERVGDLRQLCRIDRLQHDDGPARGARLLRMVTGGGLEVELHPDRCLDIGHVTWRGQPLAWASPAPVAAPALSDPDGAGWLRTFAGGLLTTCGLDHFGAPSQDGAAAFGLHGRAASLAAQHLSSRCEPSGDGTVRLEVSGEMRQAALFGENLRLLRTVESAFGSNSFTVTDSVTNLGRDPQPHMLLYHLNLGWPLIGPDCEIGIPSRRVVPRDATAAEGLPSWHTVPPPQPRWDEQVLRHDLPPDEPVTIRVTNPATQLALSLRFSAAALPQLFQWRHFRAGAYVLGLEPANCPVIQGRAAAREAGVLPVLEPEENREYALEFSAADA